MWQAIISGIAAIIPSFFKQKPAEKSYKELIEETKEDLKGDLISLKEARKKLRYRVAKELVKKAKARRGDK